MKLDNKMKRLLREMGEAINDSLSASDELTGTIDRIRQEGYDIFLILEATIGLNPKSGKAGEQTASRLPASSIEISTGADAGTASTAKDNGVNEMVFQVSPDDEQFLRSLRISVDDSGAGPRGRRSSGPAGDKPDTPEAENDEGSDEE